jgi:hypothetical protein
VSVSQKSLSPKEASLCWIYEETTDWMADQQVTSSEFTKKLTETSHSISDHLSGKGLKYGHGRVHAQIIE